MITLLDDRYRGYSIPSSTFILVWLPSVREGAQERHKIFPGFVGFGLFGSGWRVRSEVGIEAQARGIIKW